MSDIHNGGSSKHHKNRTDILTTGPMRVPGKMTGDPVGGPPDTVFVSIKNPTTRDFHIQLFADVCNPATGTEITVADRVFTIPKNSCLIRVFFFDDVLTGFILRFFAKGSLDEDAEKLELSFVGVRTSDNMQEPTLFFRHKDLIEVENIHIHKDPVNTPIGHWQ